VQTEREIFLQALEKPVPAERHAYLCEICGEDETIRRRVEALLAAYERADNFLAAPVAVAEVPADLRMCEQPGSLIGPYKLLELIGEGGMGVVYHAEQQRPVRRRVALKVIKPGMDSKQVIGRFEAERQALAMMDHPNIAKVHDGGATPEGRPFFVMELVKGLPITEYCDKTCLGTRQRLELFLDVCHAVQHAHQKGIIHRDLKPSNVLVEIHDVRPVVKIIDFGISKAIGQQLTDKTLFTGVAQMVGTPMYMSPEQAGLSSLDVDTRSDVYSLGVLLYELLTGTTPFDSETLKKAGYDEMRRIVREDEPPKPSTRLSTLQIAALSTIAERRGLEPKKLGLELRGELDWIVMKALEKDRDRRYETASTFAADIERYLHDEPVEACPPSPGYRVRKFVHRNRRALITTGVITIALVAATVVSAWQAVLAREAQRQAEADRTQAETDRDRAKAAERQAFLNERQALQNEGRARRAESRAATEAAVAAAVNRFLQYDLLGMENSRQALVDNGFWAEPDVTMRELVHRAEAKIGERFRDQPLVEAAIRNAIGNVHYSVGELNLAATHFERALALYKANLGPSNPTTFGTQNSLVFVYRDMGRYSEACDLSTDAAEHAKKTFGPEDPQACNFMDQQAQTFQKAGKLDEAERMLWALLAIDRKHKRQPAVAKDASFLSRNLLMQQKYVEAEATARESLAAYEKYRPDHFGPFVVGGLLGRALLGQGKYAAAEPLLLQAHEGFKKWERKLNGASWKWRLNEIVQHLVDFYELTNQPEKARMWREKLPTQSPASPDKSEAK
jgi:serine/threonine protein kinase/tetratricopeptide (TPR) repeat protein